MKLRRLKILKFRNVQPETELVFHDGFNVLLGQNGSGKTTLLRLITSVLRGDFLWLDQEAYALEADLDMSVGQVAFTIKHERKAAAKQSFDAALVEFRAFIPTNETWSTTIDLRVNRAEGDTWQFHSEDGSTTVIMPGLSQPNMDVFNAYRLRGELIWTAAAIFLLILAKHDKLPNSTAPHIEFVLQSFTLRDACRFDESLELFSAITGRCSALGKEDYGHITGRLERGSPKTRSAIAVVENLVPREITNLDALTNPNFDAPAESLRVRHDEAPFLATVVKMLGFVGAEIKLDLLGKEVTEEEKTIEYGNLRFFFHGRDGSIVNQDHLSYGQKRLLTFYYYLACNPHIIVADELVNGLHHAWISECIQAMGDRQVFVTSQNPILLDHLTFDSAETVRHTFITCEAKPEGVRDRLLWSNMSKKNAEAFFRAYKVGIQHVGEILRTKGLW